MGLIVRDCTPECLRSEYVAFPRLIEAKLPVGKRSGTQAWVTRSS